jgi:hypothetical protein
MQLSDLQQGAAAAPLHPDFQFADFEPAAVDPKMEDGAQVTSLPTAAEAEPISRDSSESAPAAAPQNVSQPPLGIPVLPNSSSTASSPQPRSVACSEAAKMEGHIAIRM